MFHAKEVQETMAKSYGVFDDITDADLEADQTCFRDIFDFQNQSDSYPIQPIHKRAVFLVQLTVSMIH